MVNSIRYNYINARYLEKSLPGDPRHGAWLTSYNRTLFGWGQVAEDIYPADVSNDEFFLPISAEIDRIAKSKRIRHYLRVRNSKDARKIAKENPDIFEVFRRGGDGPIPNVLRDVKVAFEYTKQFVDAPMGKIQMPEAGEVIVGSHSVPIVGLSEPNRHFIISNSWHPDWGYHSLADMPFEFFDNYIIESWAADESTPRPALSVNPLVSSNESEHAAP